MSTIRKESLGGKPAEQTALFNESVTLTCGKNCKTPSMRGWSNVQENFSKKQWFQEYIDIYVRKIRMKVFEHIILLLPMW